MTGPLSDIFPSSGGTALDDIFTPPTQSGINQAESGNISDNISQLTALRGAAKNPDDQARIDKVIASLKAQQGQVGYSSNAGFTPWGKVGAGLLSGAAKGPVDIAQLAAAVPALAGSSTAKDLRSSLEERAAQITSEVQPPGAAGAPGEFVGELPAQMLAFGPVGKAVEAGAAAVGGPLGDIFAKEVSGGIVKRAAVGAARAATEIAPISAIASASNRQEAIDAAQKAFDSGQLSQEGFDQIKSQDNLEAIKNFAASEAGAAAFGALAPPAKAGGAVKEVVGKEGAASIAPSNADLLQREAELQAINAKAKADAAKKAENKQLKKLAQAQWTLDNPTDNWRDLETSDQAKYISDFKAKQQAKATPSTPPTVPEASAPQQPAAEVQAQQDLDRAIAAGTPQEVEAAKSNLAATQTAPKTAPVATPSTATSPNLDKGGGGLSPTVKNFIQRQGLRNAFNDAGLPFDEGLTNVQLQQKLAETVNTQAASTTTATKQAEIESANRDTFDKMLSYADVGKRLGIDQEVASLHAQGKTNNEILQVVNPKLPEYLKPDEKIQLIQSIRDEFQPSRTAYPVVADNIDTSFAALTGDPTGHKMATEAVARTLEQTDIDGAEQMAMDISEGKKPMQAGLDMLGAGDNEAAVRRLATLPGKDLISEYAKLSDADQNDVGIQHKMAFVEDIADQRGVRLVDDSGQPKTAEEFRAKLDQDRAAYNMQRYKLPESLSKSDPRYGYGSRQFSLQFASDFDKAAYILQGASKSKSHDALLQHVVNSTGFPPEDIIRHGESVKLGIKEQAKIASPGSNTLNIRTEKVDPVARTVPVEGAQPSAGTEPHPPASPAVAVAAPEPKTFLKGIQTDTPLEDLTVGQLDKFKDLVSDGIVETKDSGHRQQLLGDLDALSKETQRREGQAANTSASSLPRPYKDLSPDALLANKEALQQKIPELTAHLKVAEGKEHEQLKADLADARTRLADIQSEIGAKKIEAREAQKVIRAKGVSSISTEPEGPPPIPSSEFRKAPSKLGDEMLDRQIDDIHTRLEVLDARESEPWQKRLSDLYEEKAKRSSEPEGPDGMPPIKSGDGLKLQSHPAVGAFLGGFTYGLMTPQKDDTDEEYLSRAFMWGLGSAGLVMGAKYLGARMKAIDTPKPSSSIPGIDQFPNRIISVDDIKGQKIPTTTALREWYRGITRSTDAIEAIPGVRGLPAERNPGKLAAYYGRYAAQTEHWLTVGPARVDAQGNIQHMEGLSYQGIVQGLAKGDKKGLDQLLVALSSSELAGKLGENRVPMPVNEREYIIRNAPQNLMEAAKAMRQYHANLLQTQLDAGLISKEGLAKMLEENYYTPMERVMEQLNATKGNKPLFKGQPTAIEARKGGSNLKVKSPTDVTVDMTARMLRAAEYGQMQKALVDHVASLPSVVRNEIIVPTSKALSAKAGDLEAIAAELRKTINISEADARGMVSYLDNDSIHDLPTIRDNKGFEWGIINHYDNGVIQTLKVRPDVFKALKAMTQPEKDWFWSFVGAPTRLATKGVVLDPSFAARRSFIETFLGHLGSEYGFRPGLDNMAGWLDVFTRSQRYREMQAVGGTGNVGSLQFKDIAKFGGKTAVHDAWSLTKEFKFTKAMQVLMEPFLSATRAGENLAALRHGASTIEAAYAANNVLGNVRMQGYFEGMRRFNNLSMFARPTISHVDRLLEKSGLHPFRTPEYNKTPFGQWSKNIGMPARVSSGLTLATKGFASLTLPSAALWYLNRNDDAINELRQTTIGSHYWFFRNPFVDKEASGSIIRIPKPQVIGQIFGTSVEAHLDNLYKEDPDGLQRMLSGIYDEAALNVLPQAGVIPLSLWANKDYRFGTPIVPGADEQADPSIQGFTNASLPSRVISDKLSTISAETNNETLRRSLSPAGIDYVMNTFAGMMGQDALRAVNDAMLYRRDGFLPTKEEMPIISRFLARYPSMNSSDVQKFYERDKKVQAAALTVEKIIKERPDLLGDYYAQNSDRIMLSKIHAEVRQKIADMRRAIQDVRDAPAGTYTQEESNNLQKQFTSIIVQEAQTANEIAKNMSNK